MAQSRRARVWQQNVHFAVSLVVVTAAIWGAAQMLHASTGGTASPGNARCIEGGIVLERGPWVCTAPEGGLVESVCVQTGTATFTFFADESGGCYRVRGIGTPRVEVTGGEAGGRCARISHVVVHAGS